jgi:hypothetical protein
MLKKISQLFSKLFSSPEEEVLVYEEPELADPRAVVEKVLGRGIKWFNAQEMTKEARRKYYNEAQQILNSDVFNNVVNFIIATQCQEQVKQYNPNLNINPIRDVQMMINALELLREELESINDPDKEPKLKLDLKDFDPYSLT